MESHISRSDKQVLQMILDPNQPFEDDEDSSITNGHGGKVLHFLKAFLN